MRKFFLCAVLVALTIHSGVSAVVTTTADSGAGSLRAALASATSGETITFAVTGVVTLTSGELTVQTPVNISGPGAHLLAIARADDPALSCRIFRVNAASRISGLTIRNGNMTVDYDSGGAIYNSANLSLLNCVLAHNSTSDRGGAIYNTWNSSLVVSNCQFIENRCTDEYGEGGGLYAFGFVRVINSSFIGNRAPDRGGGLHVDYFGAAELNGCTFSGNVVEGREPQGAGIYNYGSLAMTNCTVSGNTSFGTGGGLHNDGLSVALLIGSCTIVSNTGGGIYLNRVQGTRNNYIHNSIVAGNPGYDVYNRDQFISSGFNLIGTVLDHPIGPQQTDQFGISAAALQLGPLRNNGGPTATHALAPGSIAFNTGDTALSPATDQRGVSRPRYGQSDVGAFELDNLSPQIQCSSSNVELASSTGTVATINVTLSDPDGDALVAIWGWLGEEFQTNYVAATAPNTATTLSATRVFAPGLNIVPVIAFDGLSESVVCYCTVTVRDTIAPTITSVTATPNTLTPVTHKLVPVTIQVAATDASGATTSRITSVTSSDPLNGRQADWEITGALTVNLRAERSTPRTARVYTVTVETTDAAGNKTTGATTVTVPVR
jgi:hypothetical protein